MISPIFILERAVSLKFAEIATTVLLILLGKSLAIEWAKHGIRVNTVSPGYIRTWSDEPLKPEEVGQSNFEQWTPLKRFGAASEIAGIIVYLASEESSFVTGSDFVVDGGYTAF